MGVGRPRTAPHGSRSRYVAGGCRCSACRQANRLYQRRWYRGRQLAGAFYLAVAIELFSRRALRAAEGRNDRP